MIYHTHLNYLIINWDHFHNLCMYFQFKGWFGNKMMFRTSCYKYVWKLFIKGVPPTNYYYRPHYWPKEQYYCTNLSYIYLIWSTGMQMSKNVTFHLFPPFLLKFAKITQPIWSVTSKTTHICVKYFGPRRLPSNNIPK